MTRTESGPIISHMTKHTAPAKSSWVLERTLRRTPSETTFHLGTGRISDLACALKIERSGSDEGRFLVRASFTAGRAGYARAEAARFAAQMHDTAADMAVDADLEPDDTGPWITDVAISGSTVELSGTDAAIAAIAFFGGDFGSGNAADAMTDAAVLA